MYTSIPHDLGLEALQYWLNKHPELLPQRFSVNFIIEASKLILENNNFKFDGQYYHQDTGTAMGAVFAPPYACLTVGYLEETKLEMTTLPRYFCAEDCKLILHLLLRYIDDGFIPWPKRLNLQHFIDALNTLHPMIKYTIEVNVIKHVNGLRLKILNFLDVLLILHESGKVEIDIYYKDTNSHDYLDFYSHHPDHTKKNIVYGLAKKIVEFVSNYDTEQQRLEELYDYLVACNYPAGIVRKGIHNARLQGPAPDPSKKLQTIPYISTHTSNLKSERIVKMSNQLLQDVQDDRLKRAFRDSKIVLALKQPPNLLRQLSRAEFTSIPRPLQENGIFTCGRPICDICTFYLQPCKSFLTSNGIEWIVNSHITCHSKFVIYFLKCLSCNEKETYSGQTNNLRKRTNNHISGCRTSRTTDKFDLHVHKCNKTLTEPFFKLYVFVELLDASLLDAYENYIHRSNFDTMNRQKKVTHVLDDSKV